MLTPQELPHEYVPPSMLSKVATHGEINKLYATEISRKDQFERKQGGGFDPQVASSDPPPSQHLAAAVHLF